MNVKLHDQEASSDSHDVDGTLLFVGETFARICRRGAVGILEILDSAMSNCRILEIETLHLN